VDVNNQRVQIEGLNITKKDGEKVPVWFHPSKIKIIKFEDSDKKRFKHLNKKTSSKEETKKKDSLKTENNKEDKK
jgi:ribosomal protein uL24